MEQDTAAFVAMDTLKETIAVAVAEAGRSGEVRFVGEIPNRADAVRRLLDKLARTWTLRPLVEALQAMRGIAFLSAVVLVAEIGDFRRVGNPRQLMAYLGMMPSEHSSGRKVQRTGITKAGNTRPQRGGPGEASDAATGRAFRVAGRRPPEGHPQAGGATTINTTRQWKRVRLAQHKEYLLRPDVARPSRFRIALVSLR